MISKLLLKYIPDLKIVLLAVLFYLSAWLGYSLAFENATSLPFWPPSGIAFALIILLGRKAWPGVVIGTLLANTMGAWNTPPLSVQASVSVAAFIAFGNTLEVLAGNYLIKHWVKDDYPFKNTGDAFRFLFITLVMCLVGAIVGVSGLQLNGLVAPEGFLKTSFSWWIESVVGILLFTPFVLSVARKYKFTFSTKNALEAGVFFSFLLGIYFLFQVEYIHNTLERALPFLVLPFLLWLAFRFELIASIAAVLMVSLMAIYFTIHGMGPFVLAEHYNSMLLLQIFMAVLSISVIVLSATVRERTTAQLDLLRFNETLEDKIQSRTKALNDEINTRKEAEQKLQQTNQELSKRNTELDNFVYSVSHDLRAPIASVLGLINLAKRDKDVAMKDVYLEKINASAVQQDNFIKEILDQSRNSRLEVKREEIKFEPLIEETFNQLKFATSTGQSVDRVINVKQEAPFYCDRWRLKVILNNIISNSIRYRNGKDPLIKVNVAVEANHVKLEIEDNGKGIAKEHLDKVYRMFYRATDDGAGSGLGLYIVKETIDKLKGSINIISEEGRGTTVVLDIPEVQS